MSDLKVLDKHNVFYDNIEDFNEAYGVSAEITDDIQSDAQWLCFNINDFNTLKYIDQYKIEHGMLMNYNYRNSWEESTSNEINSEFDIHFNDIDEYQDNSYKYVRVGDRILENIKENFLGHECLYFSDDGRIFIEDVFTDRDDFLVKTNYGFYVNLKKVQFYLDEDTLGSYKEFCEQCCNWEKP